tara:strand:- start:1021 stop:1350 length:330 start_codon:yes stop_codon:yes gene_type:complete
MKLTTQRLKKLIREELNKLLEMNDEDHDEALTSVMNMFMQNEVEDAVKSAIHYRIADKVLEELTRLEQESMDLEQANQYSLYIDKLRFEMSKTQTGPFYDDGLDLSDQL